MEVDKKEFADMKIFIVGCGSIGKRHAGVLAFLGVTDITAYDPAEEQVQGLINAVPGVKKCSSFEEGLMQKPDAVFVLAPTKLHVPLAIQAVKADCHVFVEKPISDSLDGIDELSAVASEKKKKVMVGFCFRYHEGLVKAKNLIKSGRIGRLVSIRALMGEHFPEVRPDYRNTYYVKYSGAFELVHDLDLAIWYADQEVKKVYGVFGTFSDIDGMEAPDIVEILMEFEDRCVATVHLDFFQKPRRRAIELIGTEGVIIVEFGSWDKYTISIYDSKNKLWEEIEEKTFRNAMFIAEDTEFLKAITEDKPISCGIEEACKSLKVILDVQNKPS
ncbi:MAG TPA: Gfo/Idh/MocA family oxidoreductase [Clostridiaceae bacterium]|nr:Gfo/Idh/MocA family oxidoreductase [Clostridiaceae bacterium]